MTIHPALPCTFQRLGNPNLPNGASTTVPRNGRAAAVACMPRRTQWYMIESCVPPRCLDLCGGLCFYGFGGLRLEHHGRLGMRRLERLELVLQLARQNTSGGSHETEERRRWVEGTRC